MKYTIPLNQLTANICQLEYLAGFESLMATKRQAEAFRNNRNAFLYALVSPPSQLPGKYCCIRTFGVIIAQIVKTYARMVFTA